MKMSEKMPLGCSSAKPERELGGQLRVDVVREWWEVKKKRGKRGTDVS